MSYFFKSASDEAFDRVKVFSGSSPLGAWQFDQPTIAILGKGND